MSDDYDLTDDIAHRMDAAGRCWLSGPGFSGLPCSVHGAPEIYSRWGEQTLGPWSALAEDHREAWRDLAAKVAESDRQHTEESNDPVHETDEG